MTTIVTLEFQEYIGVFDYMDRVTLVGESEVSIEEALSWLLPFYSELSLEDKLIVPEIYRVEDEIGLEEWFRVGFAVYESLKIESGAVFLKVFSVVGKKVIRYKVNAQMYRDLSVEDAGKKVIRFKVDASTDYNQVFK